MKAKVIKTYVDRTTHIKHMRGEIVQVTDERFEEINSTSHGIFLKVETETVITSKGGQNDGDIENEASDNQDQNNASDEDEKKVLDVNQDDQIDISNKKKASK